MKYFSLPRCLAALVAGACLVAPASSYADRKIKVYRDLDGDGHFNKKTYEIPNHRYYGHSYGHSYGYYPRYSGYRYYGPRYYNYGYYRPYYYGPTFGLSFYSSPSYDYDYDYGDSYGYRSAPPASSSYDDNLAVDVQSALKRRGYYKGPVDGDIGPASRSAIRAYQSERGLSVTGSIDRSLLRSLGIG